MPDVTIKIEPPDSPGVEELLRASDAYMAKLYPMDSNHLFQLNDLKKQHVTFLVARQATNAIGCASLVYFDDYAEIKRMFVAETGRDKGIGKLLMEEIIELAKENGIFLLRLETGNAQPEAIGLYRKYGFYEIPPFGSYQPDPLSIFMEKSL